jgi:regulator of sigma E protease
MLTSVVAFVLVLGVLVFVHELGHFATAKWAKIKVEEFGFGYPPRVLTFMKRGETIYTLNLLPLGGFVKMLGEEDPTHPDSFASKSPLKRAIVLVAGSFMNLVLAITLIALISMMGAPFGPPTGRVEINGIAANSPAEAAGLQAGDYILYIGGQRVRSISTLQTLVQRFYDRPVTVTVERNGQELEVKLTPRSKPPEGQGAMGVTISDERAKITNPIAALGIGFSKTAEVTVGTLGGFGQIFTRMARGEPNQEAAVTGPVGIAQMAGEIASTGKIIDLLFFTALLSINLAIINLMPFPALDGGRLLFVIIEALRGGRRIDPRKEGMVHLIGMMVLLTLIAFISYFDIVRLFSGETIFR